MASSPTVVDHGGSGSGDSESRGYLRTHRLRLTLWIGAIEGILTLIGWFPELAVVLLAVLAVGFYVFVGRKYGSSLARHLSWIFAASQLVALLIPAVLAVAERFVAIGAVVLIAIAALVVLFLERDRL